MFRGAQTQIPDTFPGEDATLLGSQERSNRVTMSRQRHNEMRQRLMDVMNMNMGSVVEFYVVGRPYRYVYLDSSQNILFLLGTREGNSYKYENIGKKLSRMNPESKIYEFLGVYNIRLRESEIITPENIHRKQKFTFLDPDTKKFIIFV